MKRKFTFGHQAAQRNWTVADRLAERDFPVVGHVGLIPPCGTWVDGLRAFGANADEAMGFLAAIPRRAYAYGDVLKLQKQMQLERIAALPKFQSEVWDSNFPYG